MKNLIYASPFDSEENRWGSSNFQAATWHIWVHSAASALASAQLHIAVGTQMCELMVSVTNYNFFRILQWFCLISNLSQSHFDGPWHCKKTCPTYNCLTINLCFGLLCHLTKFGQGVFPHTLFVKVQVLKPPMHLWTVYFYLCGKPIYWPKLVAAYV
jgi:hypothetical protein